ncbi:MAG: hypothetical protein Q4F45_02615 [Alistipes sp.]|nr:hypothetical protein [Alistipes sp.]
MRKMFLIAVAVLFSGVAYAQSEVDVMLGKLDKYIDNLGPYKISFKLTSEDYTSDGYCLVSGDNYYIGVGDAEVYADGKVRYEVDGARKEINVDAVNVQSHNILDNPTRCFDFVGEDYSAEIVKREANKVEIHLSGNDIIEEGDIYITIDKTTGKPLSILYTLYDDKAYIDIVELKSDTTPIKKFLKSAYKGFEIIDFR